MMPVNEDMRRVVPPSLGEIGALHRRRFRQRERMLGALIKTPTVHATEIFSEVGFDFLVVDQEHAPFDNSTLDVLALASRAGGIPTLVRAADANPSRLLGILDMGFAGVIVPHISSASAAREVAEACRFANGRRGVSPSCRAGQYGGRTLQDHLDIGDRSTTVIAMIEDMDAVEAIDGILAVDGVDGILIGRVDLAVSIGEPDLRTPRMQSVVETVMAACRSAGVPVMLYLSDLAEEPSLTALGTSSFLVNSDQGFMRVAAQRVRDDFRAGTAA